MTKKELIEALQTSNLPDDTIIILSRDEEGNGFGELSELEEGVWSPRYGEVAIKELTPALVKQGFSEEDVYNGDDAVFCITLWP